MGWYFFNTSLFSLFQTFSFFFFFEQKSVTISCHRLFEYLHSYSKNDFDWYFIFLKTFFPSKRHSSFTRSHISYAHIFLMILKALHYFSYSCTTDFLQTNWFTCVCAFHTSTNQVFFFFSCPNPQLAAWLSACTLEL